MSLDVYYFHKKHALSKIPLDILEQKKKIHLTWGKGWP